MLYIQLRNSPGPVLAGPFIDRSAAEAALPVIADVTPDVEVVDLHRPACPTLNSLVHGLRAELGTRVQHRSDRERYVLPDGARWKVVRLATSRARWTVVPA